MKICVPVIVAIISFAVFFPLGLITRKWLTDRLKDPCAHEWRVLTEKYPTFTENRWKCDKCGLAENFPDSQPPVKTTLEICSMGHLHTVIKPPAEYAAYEEWPDTVGYHGWM